MSSKKSKKPRAKTVAAPDPDDKGARLASAHATLAEEHGWSVNVEQPSPGAWVVTATKDDEKCILAYRDGGILDNSKIVAVFPERTVPLRNSGGWRRQITNNRPPATRETKRIPKLPTPKVANREVTVKVEDTNGQEVDEQKLFKTTSLPFPHDAEDIEIIDLLRGRELYWRNNLASKVSHATVPSNPRMIRLSRTVRTGRRIVSFPESHIGKDGEVLGSERSVAIEDMIRVR